MFDLQFYRTRENKASIIILFSNWTSSGSNSSEKRSQKLYWTSHCSRKARISNSAMALCEWSAPNIQHREKQLTHLFLADSPFHFNACLSLIVWKREDQGDPSKVLNYNTSTSILNCYSVKHNYFSCFSNVAHIFCFSEWGDESLCVIELI